MKRGRILAHARASLCQPRRRPFISRHHPIPHRWAQKKAAGVHGRAADLNGHSRSHFVVILDIRSGFRTLVLDATPFTALGRLPFRLGPVLIKPIKAPSPYEPLVGQKNASFSTFSAKNIVNFVQIIRQPMKPCTCSCKPLPAKAASFHL